MSFHWTTSRPLVEGWYWCRCRGTLSGAIYTTMVKAYRSDTKLGPPTTAFWDGDNLSISSDCFTAWSDTPIPEPKG